MSEGRRDDLFAHLRGVLPDILFLLDSEDRILDVHTVNEDGLLAPPDAFLGESLWNFVPRDVYDVYARARRDARSSGELTTYEYNLDLPDGPHHYEARLREVSDRDRCVVMVRDMTGEHNARAALQSERHELNERVKEQRCLQEITSATADPQTPLETVLRRIVNAIPAGWQYPDRTAAAIEVDDQVYRTPDYAPSRWHQTVTRTAVPGVELTVRVVLLVPPPAGEREAFLPTEEQLLHAIADVLAAFLAHRNAIDEIRERDALVATMLSQTTDAIGFVDPETLQFLEFNATATEILGYDATTLSQSNAAVLHPDLTPPARRRMIARVLAGEELSEETSALRHDGQKIDIALTIRAVMYRGRPVLSFVWRDISEEVQKRWRDHELNRRLQSYTDVLVRLGTDPAVQTGENELFLRRSAESLAPVLQAEVVAFWLFTDKREHLKTVDVFRRSSGRHENGSQLPVCEIQDVIERIEASRVITLAESDIASPAGGLLCSGVGDARADLATGASVLVCGIFLSGGLEGIAVFVSDRKDRTWVTEEIAFGSQVADQIGIALVELRRIQTEAELEDYQLHLEELVEARTAELEAAKVRAEAASTAKSAFLSNMSHEIRTPMNAIIGYSYLIRQGTLSEDERVQLDRLTRSAKHLLEVVNNVLDISKIEAQAAQVEVVEFEPEEVIDRALDLVQEDAERKGITVRVDVREMPPVVAGDSLKFSQILINLIGNAVKFTETGGVTVTVHPIRSSPEETWLRCTVSDTGVGMNTEQLARLFTAFEQADATTTRRFGGTGLGLAITKSLVELLGGAIEVTSVPNAGTTFRVEIPFAPVQTLQSRRVGSLDGVSILVVDDDVDAREILAAILTQFGARVKTAENAGEAFSAVHAADGSEDSYRLVIMDWRMPGKDGLAAVADLRRLRLATPPDFVMLTAYRDELPGETAGGLGLAAILTKPTSPSTLYDTISPLFSVADGRSGDTNRSGERTTIAIPSAATSDSFDGYEPVKRERTRAEILLVEDNPANQEVTMGLLKAVGLSVTVAVNGSEAVELARQRTFDLVLMDMQMPVMDGLEATRRIRTLPSWRDIPIIAVTANAFGEEREQCFAAGMDEYLGKPVDPELLYAIVRKSLGSDLHFTTPDETAEITIPYINTVAGLRLVRGDADAYRRVLHQFVRHHLEDRDRLHAAVAAHDVEAVRALAHGIKGVAASIGADTLRDLALRLETCAQPAAPAAGIASATVALTEHLVELLPAVTAVLETKPEGNLGLSESWEFQGTPQEAGTKLTRLLEQSAVESNSFVVSARHELTELLGADAYTRLSTLIAEFEYDFAREIMNHSDHNEFTDAPD